MPKLIFRHFLPNPLSREWVSTFKKHLHCGHQWCTKESHLYLWTEELWSYCCMACCPPRRTGPTIPRTQHEISQQHIFMVLRISRGEAKGFGKKFSPWPAALRLFPSSTSLLPPPAFSKQTHCNSYPSISTAKHSMDDCLFNERETHWCLLPQVFPPPWFNSHLMAGGRSRSEVSAGSWVTFHVGTTLMWWHGSVSHTLGRERTQRVHHPARAFGRMEQLRRTVPWFGGACGPSAPPTLQPLNPASALKEQPKRKSTLMPKVREKLQTKRDWFFFFPSMRHLFSDRHAFSAK